MNKLFLTEKLQSLRVSAFLLPIFLGGVLWVCGGCARTEVIESPKTAFVSDAAVAKQPEVIWSSHSTTQAFDYLGEVKVRAWTYDGAVERLVEAAKSLKADAVIDVHFERVGFLTAMSAFAVKYK